RGHSELLADGVLDFVAHGKVFAEVGFGIFAPLPQQAVVVAIERAALFDDAEFRAEVEHFAALADAAFEEHDVEFGFAEGGRDLVLGHTDADAVTDDFAAARFDRLQTADVKPDAGVELERPPA